MSLYAYLLNHLIILTWRDLIEIIFFSTVFYGIMRWLQHDRAKPLLPYFYGYCALVFATHALHLSTITYCLFLFSPAIIMLFMFMHQDILQRNMIALKNITTTSVVPHDWLATIMRSTLKGLHNKKSMLILIEHTEAIADLVIADYHMNSIITDDMLTMLIEHGLCTAQQMLWIKTDGTIQGVRTSFKASWHPNTYTNTQEWIDDAIAYTSKTDALIMQSDAHTQTYSIAYSGTITHNLTTDQITQLIRKEINQSSGNTSEKGFPHDQRSAQEKEKQHFS